MIQLELLLFSKTLRASLWKSGLQFLINSWTALRPGGIAVHTTEFNVIFKPGYIEVGASVIYRKGDIEALDYRLRKLGCAYPRHWILMAGSETTWIIAFDTLLTILHGRQHVKLMIASMSSTSMLIIIEKKSNG